MVFLVSNEWIQCWSQISAESENVVTRSNLSSSIDVRDKKGTKTPSFTFVPHDMYIPIQHSVQSRQAKMVPMYHQTRGVHQEHHQRPFMNNYIRSVAILISQTALFSQ